MDALANAWPTSTAMYSNAVYSTPSASYPLYERWWTAPTLLPATYVSVDPRAFDRLMLARIAVVVEAPRSLLVLRLERRPEVVRRAPRPAGRPSGWRRARKGGRRT